MRRKIRISRSKPYSTNIAVYSEASAVGVKPQRWAGPLYGRNGPARTCRFCNDSGISATVDGEAADCCHCEASPHA